MMRLCLTLLVPVLAWVGLLIWQQDSLIYHPFGYQGELNEQALQPEFALRQLRFQTSDGAQAAVLLQRPGARPRRVYAVFGGNAMVGRQWLSLLPRATWDKDVAFLLVDYPGYGMSEGSPSMASIERAAFQALIEVTQVLNITGLEFGALGHSIGCAAAMRLASVVAATATPLRHVLLSAPFSSLAEVAKSMLPPLQVVPSSLIAIFAARNAWDNMAEAEHLARDPAKAPLVDIIHGTRDGICPQDHGRALAKRLQGLRLNATFRSVQAGHNDILDSKSFFKWLEQKLQLG